MGDHNPGKVGSPGSHRETLVIWEAQVVQTDFLSLCVSICSSE